MRYIQLVRKTCLPVSPLATLLSAYLAMISFACPALAQGLAEPLLHRELEKLLDAYVVPTLDEAELIDRAHESYLESYLAEVRPKILAFHGMHYAGGEPSEQQSRQIARELQRLAGIIAEADGRFFDALSGLLPQDRREGLQRAREARERRRALLGADFTALEVGGTVCFVDLAALLADLRVDLRVDVRWDDRGDGCYARTLSPEMREQFDALLRPQEQRALAQARAFLAALNRMNGLSEETPDGEAAAELRKLMVANFEANRAAVRPFASILPEAVYHRLRLRLAVRSIGLLGRNVVRLGGEDIENAASLRGPMAVLARLHRDQAAAPEIRTQLDSIEAAWNRDAADNTERVLDLVLSIDWRPILEGPEVDPSTDPSGHGQRIQELRRAAQDNDQRAYRAIRDVIGAERSVRLFGAPRASAAAAGGSAGQGREILVPLTAVLEPDALPECEPLPSQPTDSAEVLADVPPCWSAAQLAKVLQSVGFAESSLRELEGVVDAWRVREWDAKVGPIGARLRNARSGAEGGVERDSEKAAKVWTIRRKLVDAVFAADMELCADLAAVFGFERDGVETILVRLERIGYAREGRRPWLTAGEFGYTVPSPAEVLARGGLPADAGRAWIQQSRADWSAFADELPSLARAVMERAERLEAASRALIEANDSDAVPPAARANERAAREVVSRICELYDRAAAKAGEDPAARAAIKRARLVLMRPRVYAASECASSQLESALRLEGITDDQSLRLEVLKAEYDAVYETLSERLATGFGSDAEIGEPSAEEMLEISERWRTYEGLSLQRSECTERARSAARRILGDELASRVQGLSPRKAGW
ncbi:MAG: hypothetical protein RL354_1138 [Planctomycetota bacterium]